MAFSICNGYGYANVLHHTRNPYTGRILYQLCPLYGIDYHEQSCGCGTAYRLSGISGTPCATGKPFLFTYQFKRTIPGNVRELFRIQNSYLSILDISAQRVIDYGVTSEALTHFYLVADQVKQYLSQPVEAINVDFYRKMLDIMWKMSAEAEQMIFIVQSGEIDESKRMVLHEYIKQLQISFQNIQHINWHEQEKVILL